VERRGGEIVKVKGTSRVQGVLGVSRALGDRDLKEYITAEPEVFSGLVSETSEFLILGTDGLWDVVGNMEATDVVARAMAAASGGSDGRKGTDLASRELVDLARVRGSRDDISVLIVELREYRAGATPASSPEGKGN
jgi:protein phosphatase 1L